MNSHVVKETAVVAGPDEATLRRALACAIRAPSVWNSQPWVWRAGSRVGVDLFADRPRQQMATDPRGHDLLLSCGAALHHLVIALADEGWSARITRLPDPENVHHLAHLEDWAPTSSDPAARLARAISRRRTDRRRFSDLPVAPELLEALVEAAAECGASLHVVADHTARRRLVDAIAEAASLQQQQLGYDNEAARWTGRYAGDRDGIPPGNTVVAGPDRVGDVPMRPTPGGRLDQTPHGLEHDDASVLMLLCTEEDDRLAVLRCGEATSAVLLTATDLGLATTPLSQPLEVAETRAAISQHILGPHLHPQLVLRVGWAYGEAAELPPTPRRSLDRVLRAAFVAASGERPEGSSRGAHDQSEERPTPRATSRDAVATAEHFTIADVARASPDFRRVLWTGTHAQIVVMTIPVGREIGGEVHENTDQILTFVSGRGEADLAGRTYRVGPGEQCAVPAGTWHNFRNTGNEPLVLHTVYAPPEHAARAVYRTREQADTAEAAGQDEPPASPS